ncbi:hypothetical protein P7L78_22110 [Tistrella bauzanensis]|uniref:hypothetical protein n=1 Tax=Tistrella TaxID=171436 RepID=UPI0031F6029C
MMMLDRLIVVARAYTDASGRSLARTSMLIANTGHLLPRVVDRGGDVTTATYERCMRWFARHWPADVPWPADGGSREQWLAIDEADSAVHSRSRPAA